MQVVDFSRLSLAEFTQKTSWRNPAPTSKRKPRHDLVDALRTIYWYSGVEQAANIFSARGLERRFEPEAFWESDHGEKLRRNKWSKYRVGRHVPSESIVLKVEAEFPGLRSDLNHPLWKFLSLRNISQGTSETDFLLLSPEIQQLIRRRGRSLTGGKDRPTNRDGHVAAVLERCPSLNALAAIVFLLRVAHEQGRSQDALAWGRRLYRMLVLIGHELIDRNVAMPLFELLEQRIMPMAQSGEFRYRFPSARYLDAVKELNTALHHVAIAPYETMDEQQKSAHRLGFIAGKYGYDCRYAFNPVRDTCSEMSTISDEERDLVAGDWDLFTWAWNMLATGGHSELPPIAALKGTDLWARRTEESVHDDAECLKIQIAPD